MSAAESVYNRLNAASSFTALLLGGVYLFRDLPSNGISRTNTPTAYGVNGLMRAICVVKGRGVIPTQFLRDYQYQYISTQQVVELWFQNDKNAGWDTLHNAAHVAYGLLHERPLTDTFQMVFVNAVDDFRDREMNDACTLRHDYQVIAKKEV